MAQDYPYSALFDIDKLKAEEEARKAQLQASQQKIMRTNAVGDALRLLFDAVGGSQGASITPKAVNPGIIKASQRYNALEDQSTSNMDRLRLQDLAMKEKDLGYKLGQEQNEEAFGRQKELLSKQNEAKTQSDAAEALRRSNESAKEHGYKIKEIEAQGKAQRGLENYRTNENIRQYDATTGKYKDETFLASNEGRVTRLKPMAKTDLLFQIPGTNQKIYIGKEEADEMAYLLLEKGIQNPTLAALKMNSPVRMASLLQVIKENWDIARQAIPDLADPEQQAPNTPLLPGYQAPQAVPYQQGQGPLRNFGSPQPAQSQAVTPTAQPTELAKTIFNDAKSIYDNGKTAEQVSIDLKKLINAQYPDADPNTKAAIYNDIIAKF
jgi:hypothetical protein